MQIIGRLLNLPTRTSGLCKNFTTQYMKVNWTLYLSPYLGRITEFRMSDKLSEQLISTMAKIGNLKHFSSYKRKDRLYKK